MGILLYCKYMRYMVAHHDSLKLCSDRDLPIWLLRKRHNLRRTLRDPEDNGRGDNLILEDLFSEMTEEEGLEQRTQTQEIDSRDEVITDVPMFA